jgi:hypothetical protein
MKIIDRTGSGATFPPSPATVQNNVDSGGNNNSIENLSGGVSTAGTGSDTVDLTSVPNRDDINSRLTEIKTDVYQLARKVKQINDGLRALGLFTS